MGFKKPMPPPGWKPDRADQHLDAIRAEAEYQKTEWGMGAPLEIIMVGICSLVNRGAAIVREDMVLFWCPYRHRYGPYDNELNDNLMDTMRSVTAMSSTGACH